MFRFHMRRIWELKIVLTLISLVPDCWQLQDNLTMKKPKLVVFDLDYTLWPFWVDTHVTPPFQKKDNGVYDRHGSKVKYFGDVPNILQKLQDYGIQIGVASRTTCTEEAKQLVKLFDWEKYLNYKEIYPGCKINHFKKFHQLSGIPYKDMLFFDDEHRNIVDVSKLGVTCILAAEGVTESVFHKGLLTFAENNQKSHADL